MSEAILQMLYGTYRLLLVTLVVFFVTSARFPIVMATEGVIGGVQIPLRKVIRLQTQVRTLWVQIPVPAKNFFPKISIKVNLNEHGDLIFVH